MKLKPMPVALDLRVLAGAARDGTTSRSIRRHRARQQRRGRSKQ